MTVAARALGFVSAITLLPIAAAPAAPAPAAPAAPVYRVNPGDSLDIDVWGEDKLRRTVQVLPDGTFAFPLVGTVSALNRSTDEIAADLAKGLRPQFRDSVPQVTVSVSSTAGYRYSVIGKVASPGSFSPTRSLNVLEAIAAAGGPTSFANIGNVAILRRRDGKLVYTQVRLTDTLKGRPSSEDLSRDGLPQIQSGDIVVVP